MISVLHKAYFKQASMHPNYSDLHERILFVLLSEGKYYSINELSSFTHNELELQKILKDLEESGTIITEGWLVRSKRSSEFEETICQELTLI